MRDDVLALAYLAWRQIVNAIREGLKKPGRVVLWVFVGFCIAASLAVRIVAGALGRHDGRPIISPGIPEPWRTHDS